MALNNPLEVIKRGTLGSPQIGRTILGNIPSIPAISTQSFFFFTADGILDFITIQRNAMGFIV